VLALVLHHPTPDTVVAPPPRFAVTDHILVVLFVVNKAFGRVPIWDAQRGNQYVQSAHAVIFAGAVVVNNRKIVKTILKKSLRFMQELYQHRQLTDSAHCRILMYITRIGLDKIIHDFVIPVPARSLPG